MCVCVCVCVCLYVYVFVCICMFRVVAAVVTCGTALGKASSFTPDYAKAKIAAAQLFTLLDRVPKISMNPAEGQTWVRERERDKKRDRDTEEGGHLLSVQGCE